MKDVINVEFLRTIDNNTRLLLSRALLRLAQSFSYSLYVAYDFQKLVAFVLDPNPESWYWSMPDSNRLKAVRCLNDIKKSTSIMDATRIQGMYGSFRVIDARPLESISPRLILTDNELNLLKQLIL